REARIALAADLAALAGERVLTLETAARLRAVKQCPHTDAVVVHGTIAAPLRHLGQPVRRLRTGDARKGNITGMIDDSLNPKLVTFKRGGANVGPLHLREPSIGRV